MHFEIEIQRWINNNTRTIQIQGKLVTRTMYVRTACLGKASTVRPTLGAGKGEINKLHQTSHCEQWVCQQRNRLPYVYTSIATIITVRQIPVPRSVVACHNHFKINSTINKVQWHWHTKKRVTKILILNKY